MVFENRVLREIFWSNTDEVKWEWRKVHNEEFNDLYCSPNRNEIGGNCSTYGEKRGAFRILVCRSDGTTPLVKHNCR